MGTSQECFPKPLLMLVYRQDHCAIPTIRPMMQSPEVEVEYQHRSWQTTDKYLQSSANSFRDFFSPVMTRLTTKSPAMMMKVTPVPRTVGVSDSPPSKSGGAPLGFGAKGICDGSIPGGSPSMLGNADDCVTRNYRWKRRG